VNIVFILAGKEKEFNKLRNYNNFEHQHNVHDKCGLAIPWQAARLVRYVKKYTSGMRGIIAVRAPRI
jgi:hypothetical protein